MKRFSLSILFLLIISFTNAQIKLPKLISDGMVLQRNTKVKLWGWASPNEKITLEFKNEKFNATTDKEGKWMIELPAQKAGGPYEMTFAASNKIVLKDILFGDVWVCSGQSNMETDMNRVRDKYPDIVAKANNANIRQFIVPDKYDFQKQCNDVDAGEWLSVNPQNIFKFSAVAFFFASELYDKYKVPIGLINSAVGGSPIEAWLSEDALKRFSDKLEEAHKYRDKNLISQIESSQGKASHDWYELLNKTDEGLQNHWRNFDVDDSNWSTMNVPGYWADEIGNVNGAVWFRKEIDVPKNMIDKPAKLWLGRIIDADSVFINGVFIGTVSYQYPPRKYNVPANLLKEGKNVIAVRIISNGGKGGFVLDKPYWLFNDKDSIDLKGKWKYKVGAKMQPMQGGITIRNQSEGLFNAMIAPLLSYSIKGVLWYQGESNASKAAAYGDALKALIEDWRDHWQQKELPVLYVQLPNFMETKSEPFESDWATLRQQQLNTLSVPNTGMAVAIDVGEWNDIHPMNKKDVGHRLALQAERVVYKEKNITTSPLYQSIKKNGNKLEISFSNIGNGLIIYKNNELSYFSIAGADKKFVWAKAEIKNNKVIVWSDVITDPKFVRYAWADNPEGANLYNKELLPASPFEAEVK